MIDDDDFVNDSIDNEKRNFQFLKTNNELFNEDSYITHKIVNVKRVNLPNKEEGWEIWEDNKLSLNLKGEYFNTTEKKFLQTIEGMQFLIAEYKAGCTSVLKIKNRLSQVLGND